MNKDNINEFASFDEYLRQGEPLQKERAENWKTAIGLQAVDGLQPSAYLIDVAKRNIEGEISLDETRKLIDSYYQSKTVRTPKDEDEEEADKVSANIAKILASNIPHEAPFCDHVTCELGQVVNIGNHKLGHDL